MEGNGNWNTVAEPVGVGTVSDGAPTVVDSVGSEEKTEKSVIEYYYECGCDGTLHCYLWSVWWRISTQLTRWCPLERVWRGKCDCD